MLVRLTGGAALGAMLSGCIAAAVPVAASSVIVKQRMDARREARAAAATVVPSSSPVATVSAPHPALAAASAETRPGVPETMQYLYGSGEAAALSAQAYGALTTYLTGRVAAAKRGGMRQAILADGATLADPYFDPCGKKPLAMVLDIDETVLLNLGYEGDAAKRGGSYDEPRWQRWEQSGADRVAAVPGAIAALTAARKAGVAVIFNTNRSAANAERTEAALNGAGLGPAKHGTTLWLKGDDGGGSGKDDRRWSIASGYCVVALVGDQLGDFSDLFNDPKLTTPARRALAVSPLIAPMWGDGWFMLPNPVYGSGLKGGFDDVFPNETRWSDPAEERK